MVTAVDSGGTESVQSLAVKPASIASGGGGGGGGGAGGCYIRAVGHPTLQPYLVLLLICAIVVAITSRRPRNLRDFTS